MKCSIVSTSTSDESDFLQTQTCKRKHVQENKEKRMKWENERLLCKIEELKSSLTKRDEMIRKLLANRNESRGTIYSLVRVRPSAAAAQVHMSDDRSRLGPFVFHEDGKSLTVVNPENKQEKTYNFDRVFQAHAEQTDLFEAVSNHVQSALDGCQVCILSYGESGSGKVRVRMVLVISMIAIHSSIFLCTRYHPDAHNSRRFKK